MAFLGSLADLFLAGAGRIDLGPSDPPSVWVHATRFTAQWLGTPGQGKKRTLRLQLPGDRLRSLCRPEEAALLQAAISIDSWDMEMAERSLDTLACWGPRQFFAIDLLRARLERLKGRPQRASAHYASAIQFAQGHVPRWNCLLEVISKEAGSV